MTRDKGDKYLLETLEEVITLMAELDKKTINHNMEESKEYYAFISYKREDEKWAKWLQHKLEHYKFPTNLNGRTDLPKNIRPTFRDVTDLKPGLLAEEINNALLNSEWLIVVCSPRAAKSPWVCKEAQAFIDLGRADHIIPFVIEGIPFSNNPSTECYPEALLNLTGRKELLAANINEMGRDAAVVKVVSRMFGLKFDTLWQRYKRDQKRLAIIRLSIASLFVILTSVLLFSIVKYYDKKVVEFCKTGIKVDNGLFNTQERLLDYQKNDWLLTKDTRSLLKYTIYEVDYSYNISPFPIPYSYHLNGGMIDQLKFSHDESRIVVGSGISETSGVLDYVRGKFKRFNHFASSLDYNHNGDTIITCGMGVYKYDKNAKTLDKYEIEGYGMVVSPHRNCFTCNNMNTLTTYRLTDGKKMAESEFDKDILCYAYNKSGEYLAVATIDTLLSYIQTETGKIVWQRKSLLPIGAITAAQDDSSFYAAFYGDSTRVSRIEVGSSLNEKQFFTVPRYFHIFHKDVLSYTTCDHVAFTNGHYFVLYDIRNGERIILDIKNAFNAEMDAVAMSPSGTKVCYSYNGKVYVAEIKDKTKTQRFPIQQYGFNNVTGPTVAKIYPNDTTIVMAVIKDEENTTVGLYNLYTGDKYGDSFETTAPVWKIVPLPESNRVAVAMEANNSWEIIDFNNATSIKKFATDTLTCTSNLMLSANRKYLIGSFTGPYNFMSNDSRCVWSATTYDCLDSVYYLSGPLQDGKHFYYDYGVYLYPERKKLFQTTDLSNVEDEIFDNDEMAFVEMSSLSMYDFRKRQKKSIYLKNYGQGEANNYRLMGFKNGFAILFNSKHLIIIDTKNGDLVLQKVTTPYECITSASFFNNQSRVLVTTNAALYVFDLYEYDQLIDIWKNRLGHFGTTYDNNKQRDTTMQELTKLKDERLRTAVDSNLQIKMKGKKYHVGEGKKCY